MKRTIAVVTSSRADYSHLYWPLHDLARREDVDLKLIVLGAHLSPQFGETVKEIEKDGLPIAARLECLLSSDTDVGMAKTLGVAVLSLADLLGQMRPDLLLLIADRYEMLAPAAVALTLRIPIAHIEGGEISEGAIDDAVRNALTKMSHIHFTSTEGARARVIAMGEEPWRVHRAGAPSLDHLRRSRLLDIHELGGATRSRAQTSYGRGRVSSGDHHAGYNAGGRFPLCCPADKWTHKYSSATPTPMRAAMRCWRGREPFSQLAAVPKSTSIWTRSTYWSLLRQVALLIGNSSSGIMEAASFALPVVNVGFRQKGRERARNVLDAEPETHAILARMTEALSAEFHESLAGMTNPYGDGHASQKIVQVLTTVPLSEELIVKRAVTLP